MDIFYFHSIISLSFFKSIKLYDYTFLWWCIHLIVLNYYFEGKIDFFSCCKKTDIKRKFFTSVVEDVEYISFRIGAQMCFSFFWLDIWLKIRKQNGIGISNLERKIMREMRSLRNNARSIPLLRQELGKFSFWKMRWVRFYLTFLYF